MQAHSVKGYVLLLLCVSLSGCIDDGREGKFVNHWIACEKDADGSWTLARKGYNRFNVVYETRFQVSFAAQRVVAGTIFALKNCTVYNRENWRCEDPVDGTKFLVSEGEMIGTNCTYDSCSLEVDSLDRITILIGGIELAERLCKRSSKFLDTMKPLMNPQNQ